jgi:uncharacterized protein (DUF2062 family)
VGRLRTGLRALLSIGGTPHGIAGGFTMGLCLSLLPIPFAGMLLALAAAPLLRLNLAATYVGTAVVNPLTGAFFYAAELWLGMRLMGAVPPSWSELRALDATGWWQLLIDLVVPFAIGAAVMMVASVLVAYPLVRLAVTRWRNPSVPAKAEATSELAPPT